MKTITIIGAGMMGSALAFPARENGNEVRLVGTHLDREIIDTCRATGRHPKFVKDFPAGLEYYQIEQVDAAIDGADLIIALGHLGVDESSKPWTSEEVILNTSGLDAFIDGHSHTVMEAEAVADKDGNEVFNKLSELALRASARLKMIDPKINLRVNKNTPLEVYEPAFSSQLSATVTAPHSSSEPMYVRLERL